MARSKCVKAKKKQAEETRRKLINRNALNQRYKVKKDKKNVYFPVKKDLEEFKTVEKDVEPKETKPSSLEEALEGKITSEESENLVTSFDIIGDIAVIEVPEEIRGKEKEIGEAIMKVHPNVSTVCRRELKTQGKYRIRPVHVIAGEEKTETTHIEHGVSMKVDLNKSYFNPRLSHEREIISEKVKAKEEIGYLFAGVGPFALVIAEENPDVKITAVELNPGAYRYLEENIKLNHFSDKITAVKSDVSNIEGYSFDRVIMPLPHSSEQFLDKVIENTSEEPVIHYYSIGEEPDYFKKPLKELENHIDDFEVLEKREVLNYAPGKKEVVIDVKIKEP